MVTVVVLPTLVPDPPIPVSPEVPLPEPLVVVGVGEAVGDELVVGVGDAVGEGEVDGDGETVGEGEVDGDGDGSIPFVTL